MPEKLRGREELQNKEKGKWDGSRGLMGTSAVTMLDLINQSWQSFRMSLDSHRILIKVPDIYHHALEPACLSFIANHAVRVRHLGTAGPVGSQGYFAIRYKSPNNNHLLGTTCRGRARTSIYTYHKLQGTLSNRKLVVINANAHRRKQGWWWYVAVVVTGAKGSTYDHLKGELISQVQRSTAKWEIRPQMARSSKIQKKPGNILKWEICFLKVGIQFRKKIKEW